MGELIKEITTESVSRLLEIARVLVRFDNITSVIVNANQSEV